MLVRLVCRSPVMCAAPWSACRQLRTSPGGYYVPAYCSTLNILAREPFACKGDGLSFMSSSLTSPGGSGRPSARSLDAGRPGSEHLRLVLAECELAIGGGTRDCTEHFPNTRSRPAGPLRAQYRADAAGRPSHALHQGAVVGGISPAEAVAHRPQSALRELANAMERPLWRGADLRRQARAPRPRPARGDSAADTGQLQAREARVAFLHQLPP
jgi:hypothetical protein